MPAELVLPAYLLVGAAGGAWGLWRADRRPGEALPPLSRLGVWAHFVGQAAFWWLPWLVFAGLAAVWRAAFGGRVEPEEPEPVAFAVDAAGRVILGRGGGWGDPVGAAFFTLVAAGMLAGVWAQERALNAFSAGATAFLTVVGTVPAALILRQWRAGRDGLRAERAPQGWALLWTEAGFWNREPRRLPLAEVERAAAWESDPTDYAPGLALALADRADGLGNVHPAVTRANAASIVPGFPAAFAGVPPGRLILWDDGAFDWDPPAVLAWLADRGVPTDEPPADRLTPAAP